MFIASCWFILGLLFFFMELIVPGFVIFFFGIGAVITSLVTWFIPDCSPVAQGICFSICSILSLVAGRLWLLRKKKRPAPEADTDGILGTVVEVVSAIEPPRSGRVLLHGAEWSAKADTPIAKGTMVVVTARENITLIVKES